MKTTNKTSRLYPRRATGGDRDHRNSGRTVAACDSGGPRSGAPQPVPEQSQAAGPGAQQLCRSQKEVSTRSVGRHDRVYERRLRLGGVDAAVPRRTIAVRSRSSRKSRRAFSIHVSARPSRSSPEATRFCRCFVALRRNLDRSSTDLHPQLVHGLGYATSDYKASTGEGDNGIFFRRGRTGGNSVPGGTQDELHAQPARRRHRRTQQDASRLASRPTTRKLHLSTRHLHLQLADLDGRIWKRRLRRG